MTTPPDAAAPTPPPTPRRSAQAEPGTAPGPAPRPVRRPAPWRVVVPVKDTRRGKSRLGRAVGADRSELSRAIADDTLAAVVATVGPGPVVLVTSDADLAQHWSGRGVAVVADPGDGLNQAVVAGQKAAAAGSRVAALLGDVPALDAGSFAAALEAAAAYPEAFVPDVEGTGTVLRCGTGFTPRFGADSAARHEADGAHRLDLDLPRLRTDVDDAASLAAARHLGLGPATRAVLERRGSAWIRSMQATVHRYDPETRTGSLLRDDGVELRFDATAFDASGLRLLRVGQRLTVDVVDDVVVGLRIVGVGPGQRIV